MRRRVKRGLSSTRSRRTTSATGGLQHPVVPCVFRGRDARALVSRKDLWYSTSDSGDGDEDMIRGFRRFAVPLLGIFFAFMTGLPLRI